MPAYITAGEVFTSVAPGKSVTATRLNNHVNALTILPNFITDQTAGTPTLADFVVWSNAAGNAMKKVTLTNLFGTQVADAAAGTASLRTLGFTGNKAAPGVETPALAATENVFTGKQRFNHISGTIGITILANANLGSTGAATLDSVATDISGIIQLIPGGTSIANGAQATMTFGLTHSFTPHVSVQAYNPAAILAQSSTKAVGVSAASTTAFTISTNGAALVSGTTYQYLYRVTGS